MDANDVSVKFSMRPDESVKQTQQILQNVAQSLDNIGKRSQAVSAQMASVGESLQQNATLMSRRIRMGFVFMSAGPLMNFVKRAFTVTESIYDMSQATGMSTQRINQMQGAFALAGIEVARTNNLIMALNSSMLRAQLRIKYMGRIPRTLMPVLDLLPSITNGSSFDKTLFALSDRLSQFSQREARGVLAELGVTDARLQDMLSHGSQVLKEYLERGKKLAVINDRLVEDSWRLRKAWVSTTYSIRMSAMETFGDVAPVLGSLGEIISNVAQHIKAFKPLLFVGAVSLLSFAGHWAKTLLAPLVMGPGKLFGGAIAGALALNDLSSWGKGGKSALPNVWAMLFGSPEKFRGDVNAGIGMLREVTGGASKLFDGVQDLWKSMGMGGGELASSMMLGWIVNRGRGVVQAGTTDLKLQRQAYLEQLRERQKRGETLSVEEQTRLNMSNVFDVIGSAIGTAIGPFAKSGSAVPPLIGEAIAEIGEILAVNRAKRTGKPVSADWFSDFVNGPAGEPLLMGLHFSSLIGGEAGLVIGIIVSIAATLSNIWGTISDWWKEHVSSSGKAFEKIDGKMVETFGQWWSSMAAQLGGEFDRLSPKEKAQGYIRHLRALGLNDEQTMGMAQNAINDPDTGNVIRNFLTEAISGLNTAGALAPSGDSTTQKIVEGIDEATSRLDDIKKTALAIERVLGPRSVFDSYAADYSGPDTNVLNSGGSAR